MTTTAATTTGTAATTGPAVQLAADILLPELLDTDLGWMSLGQCRQYNGDDWFPERGDPVTGRQAKRICAGCDVINQCAAYALDRREPYGVWGGLTAADRTQILRARARARRRDNGGASTPNAA